MMEQKQDKQQVQDKNESVMSRKQALKKAGLLTLSAATMLILMKSPAKADSSTPTPPPGW
jgi:hypothetical protein